MPYPLRVCFDGAIYHVTVRGDNRDLIFYDEQDYQHYLMLLRRYKTKYRFTLHAYAFMPNHVHLLLEPRSGDTVSRIMQSLTIAYTRHVNTRYSRVGHVFQGRFHSRLIERDVYLLVASRYVHLNPVRAKLVRQPGDYGWSSYRAYQDPSQNLLRLADTDTVLSLMTQHHERQRVAYCEFVEMPTTRETHQRESELACLEI